VPLVPSHRINSPAFASLGLGLEPHSPCVISFCSVSLMPTCVSSPLTSPPDFSHSHVRAQRSTLNGDMLKVGCEKTLLGVDTSAGFLGALTSTRSGVLMVNATNRLGPPRVPLLLVSPV